MCHAAQIAAHRAICDAMALHQAVSDSSYFNEQRRRLPTCS